MAIELSPYTVVLPFMYMYKLSKSSQGKKQLPELYHTCWRNTYSGFGMGWLRSEVSSLQPGSQTHPKPRWIFQFYHLNRFGWIWCSLKNILYWSLLRIQISAPFQKSGHGQSNSFPASEHELTTHALVQPNAPSSGIDEIRPLRANSNGKQPTHSYLG